MPSTNSMAVGLMAALAAPAAAFWRLPCTAPLVVQRADPLISPGAVSGHVHTIMGGNGFGFTEDYADTQASTCSSCTVTKDFSNYWVPTLYYQAENGSFISVEQNGGGTIYYLQRSDPADPEYSSGLLAFPEGFRMVAGNPFLRNYTDTVEQQAISFACLGTNNAETNGLPNYNCPDGLRAQVFFPSCWNGKDLDSDDHKSHMSYPSVYNAGYCPPDFPKRTISLFYEVTWEVDAFADMWYGDSQPFVFAMGDDTGYGYHGDFINGWDVPTLQKAVTECTDDSGVIEDCPVFEFFDDGIPQGCKIPASIDEQVTGVLSALPGCNPVQSGPELAVSQVGCASQGIIGTLENPFVDLTVSKGFEYLGCGTDIYGQTRTLDGASTSADNMTVEGCVDYCVAQGFSIAGLEYADECYCGNSVPADRAPIAGIMGNCYMPCAGDANENCGGAGTISLYQKCSAGSCANVVYGVNNSTLSSGSGSTSASVSSNSSTSASISSISTSAMIVRTAVAISSSGTAVSSIVSSGTAAPFASSYSAVGYNATTSFAAAAAAASSSSSSAPAALGTDCVLSTHTVTVATTTVTRFSTGTAAAEHLHKHKRAHERAY